MAGSEKRGIAVSEEAKILDSLGDCILVYGFSGELLYVNNTLCRALGYLRGELLGKNIRDILAAPYLRLFASRLRKLRAEGELTVPSGYRRKRGGVCQVEVRCAITSLNGRKCVLCLAGGRKSGAKKWAELSRVKERYKRLVEGLKNEYFFYQHGTDGKFTYLSPSIKNVLGYKPVQFLKHYMEYVTDNPVNRQVVKRTEAGIKGRPQPPYNIEILHANGGKRWLEVLEVPVKDERGRVTFVEGIAHDITGRMNERSELEKYRSQLETLVQERTAELKAVFDNAPILMLLLDEKLDVVRANTENAKKTRPAEKEGSFGRIGDVLGCINSRNGSCGSMVQCGGCDINQAARKSLRTGKPVSREEVCLRVPGAMGAEKNYYLLSISVIKVSGIRRLLLCLDDITPQKMAEESLRRAEEFSRLILSSAADGIVGVNTAGRTLFMNESAQRMLGWTLDELKGKPLHPLIHRSRADGSPYPLEQCPMFLAYARTLENVVEEETLWRRDGTSFPARYAATPMFHNGTVSGAVIVFSDTTERKKLEEAKDFLAHSIVHDLKNPLTAISCGVELLRESFSPKLEKEQKDIFNVISNMSAEMKNMISDILDISRIREGKLKLSAAALDMRSALSEAAGRLKTMGKAEGKTIKVNVPAGLRPVKADPELLQRVLGNLLMNALKFSPAGSVVEVSARLCRRCQPGGADPRARYMLIAVADKGRGIAPEHLDRIFDKFVQTGGEADRKLGGKGLGLTFCKMAVEAHGGRLWAESALGKGSVFYLTLPLDRAQ